MKTGAEYRASLRDGRATWFEGKRVDDLEAHPVLGPSVAEVAATYDRFYSPEPDAVSPLMGVPGSAAELRARIPILHQADLVANVTYQSIMTLAHRGLAHRADCPRIRRAHRRLRGPRPAAGPPHHRVHHRREGRPQPARRRSRTTPTPTCAWWTASATAS